jgi:hypothetical protein
MELKSEVKMSDTADPEIQASVETYGFVMDEQLKEKFASVYGQKALELAHLLHCIESELRSREETPPHILYQLIRNFLCAVHSQDPIQFHHDLAKKTLEKEFDGKPVDSGIVDLLARELCNKLNEIGVKIFPIQWMERYGKEFECKVTEKEAESSVLNILEVEGPQANVDCFDKKGEFIPMKVYLKFLESTGQRGKAVAKKMRDVEAQADVDFWFELHGKEAKLSFFHSPAFLGIARILWEDKVKKRVFFDRKYPPTIIKPNFDKVTSLLRAKPDRKVYEEGNSSKALNLTKDTDVIGRIDFTLVPEPFAKQVFKGAGKFNTVVGHKTIRYAANIPFEQKLQGIPDFRVKQFDGGFAEWGEQIGLTNNRQVDELREIAYAMKHLDIAIAGSSQVTKGRLIDIAHFRSEKTGREDGLILTVLPTLFGYGAITASGNLLIPMATLAPPAQGVVPNQYRGDLYYLQMILLGDISDKSIEYSQHGCVKLSDEEWASLLKRANIPFKHKPKIIEAWTSDGGDAPKILEYMEKDHFKLASEYSKIDQHITDQGKLRVKQSLRGKASRKKTKEGKDKGSRKR